jgi:pyruvate,water dikinase
VLRDSTAGGLQRGDVLVATTTDASWAPLFMSAAAVVVEEGGPLSHAAILARELGIPAVVNLPGIVARLEHEQRVVAVDGDLGEVTVLDDEAEGPGSP